MSQLDLIAARIAAMQFDAATTFKLGVVLAPIVLGEPEPESESKPHAPRRRRANGARKSPLERAQAVLAKHPGVSAGELQKHARCGAAIAKRAMAPRRANGNGHAVARREPAPELAESD